MTTTRRNSTSARPRVSRLAQELAALQTHHQDILKALQDGMTYREIAGKVGSTPDMISRYVHRNDLPSRPKGYPKGRPRQSDTQSSDERLKLIQELRAQNLTLEQIAERVGLTSKERVRQILQRAGQPGTRQEIAAERILIIAAIEPYIATGLSIDRIAEQLKDQEITKLDIVDTLTACKKNYYERFAERTKDPWPNLPAILAAMVRLRAALAKRAEVKEDRHTLRAQRSAIIAQVLGKFSQDSLREVAQKTGFHFATITTLAHGKRRLTKKIWEALIVHFPELLSAPTPE